MTHPALVTALAKDGQEIKDSLSPLDCDILHMALLLVTEAGELADAIKKAVIYRKPIDLVNVKEEFGDIEFALERLRQIFNLTRDETIEANIIKLQKRYGDKYSDQAAQERKDKQ